jgi:cytochrome b pre-mRNA-processing protein 3
MLNGASTRLIRGGGALNLLTRMLGRRDDKPRLAPLYSAVVAAAREPGWYRDGGVPDTIDGRFDMVASLLAAVLIRLEAEGEAARADSVRLTEIFIDDMDGSLRQLGIGDVVVGKHVGKMMGALGGRLGAFRSAFAGKEDLGEAVRRNIFRHSARSPAAVELVGARLEAFHGRLKEATLEQLRAGALPEA